MHTNWFSRPFPTSNSPPHRWVCWWLILALSGTLTSFWRALPISLLSPSTQSNSLPYSFLPLCLSSSSACWLWRISAKKCLRRHRSGAQCESQPALRSNHRQNASNESWIDVYSELGAQRKRLVHRNGTVRRFLPRLCVRLCELFPSHFANQQA